MELKVMVILSGILFPIMCEQNQRQNIGYDNF